MFRRFDLGLVRIVPAAVALLVFAQTATLPATQDPPLPPDSEIVAKHVKAMGGEAALQGHQVHPRAAAASRCPRSGFPATSR